MSFMNVVVSRWLSFMPTICGILTKCLERLDRQRDVMQCRIVIDQDVQLREQLGDLAEEAHRVLDRRGEIIRHAEQDAVGRRVGNHAHLLDRLARIHRGHADEQRHAPAHDVDASRASVCEFVRQERVALAEAAGGGDHVGAVADHAVEAGAQPLDADRVGRAQIRRLVRGKGRHHRHHAVDIARCEHRLSPLSPENTVTIVRAGQAVQAAANSLCVLKTTGFVVPAGPSWRTVLQELQNAFVPPRPAFRPRLRSCASDGGARIAPRPGRARTWRPGVSSAPATARRSIAARCSSSSSATRGSC